MEAPPRYWRTQRARYRLEGVVCDNCRVTVFPPREVCAQCRRPFDRVQVLSGVGEVYSYAVVHQAPAEFADAVPYTVALVRLVEGPLLAAQLADIGPGDAVAIGMPVSVVTRRMRADGSQGIAIYAYKFRPLLDGRS